MTKLNLCVQVFKEYLVPFCANQKFFRVNGYSCLLSILLTFASCSKTPETAAKLTDESGKSKARTSSSVIFHDKDDTPSVSSISSSNVKVALYSIGPIDVEAGDVVTAHLQQELTTSSTTLHVMIGCYIVATTAAQPTTNGIGYITKASTSNLDPDHEGTAEVITRNGSYTFAQDYDDVYINAVFYAANLTSPPSPSLTVPAGAYGELVAVVERGVTTHRASTYQSTLPTSGSKRYAPASPVVQWSVGPLTIPAQTMVDVRYQVEGTSEKALSTTPTHRLGKRVLHGSSATATGGVDLVPANQGGIPRHSEHHHTFGHAGGRYYSSSSSNVFFNSVVYNKEVTSPDILYIEPEHYGHFVVEMRPYNYFQQDSLRNISSVTSTTGQVLYSVGPFNTAAGDVFEIRYLAVFAPPTGSGAPIPFTSKIIRATSPNSTSGTLVQPQLWRSFGRNYTYTNAIHSTAEKISPSTAGNGQYYNVIVRSPSGVTIPVQQWGELEVIKR